MKSFCCGSFFVSPYCPAQRADTRMQNSAQIYVQILRHLLTFTTINDIIFMYCLGAQPKYILKGKTSLLNKDERHKHI